MGLYFLLEDAFMNKATPFLAALALAVAGAASAQDVSIPELASRWTAAYNQGNAEALAALYSPNAEVYIHGDQRLIGRADIKAYWAKDMGIQAPMTVLTVTDTVVDTQMMLVHGNYQVLNRITGVQEGLGRFAHIWVRNSAAGPWMLDRDLWIDPNHGNPAPTKK